MKTLVHCKIEVCVLLFVPVFPCLSVARCDVAHSVRSGATDSEIRRMVDWGQLERQTEQLAAKINKLRFGHFYLLKTEGLTFTFKGRLV